MNIEELIALSVDGQLTPEEQAQVDAALSESPALRKLHDDLMALQSMALPEPKAPDLTPAFMERVEAESKSQFRVIPGGFRRIPGPLLAMAAALVLLFAASYFSERSGPAELPVEVQWESQSLAYHMNIAPLEALAIERMGQLDDSRIRGFMQQLAFVNRMVNRCERSMANAPDNPKVHQALAEVYQAKVALLEAIVAEA